MCIYAHLCVYIVMGNLCLFLIECVKLWVYILALCLKRAKRLINIYFHNNLRYIGQSYTLLYILIMQLKLRIVYLFA